MKLILTMVWQFVKASLRITNWVFSGVINVLRKVVIKINKSTNIEETCSDNQANIYNL